ncbi:MAG: WG repeat-containing protein, partial [Candidatus Brocadiia bacterium]
KPFSNSRAAVYKNGWGYIDRLGRWVIPPIYEDAEPNVDGLASVKLGGRWGGIDAEGKQVFPFLSPWPLDFFGDFASFSDCSPWRYLDSTGKAVFDQQIEWISDFVSGIAMAKINGMRGLIDARGNWVLAPVYHQILPVGEGRFVFSRAPLNGKLGLLQADGKIICEPLFDEVGEFSEGRLRVMLTLYDEKKWGFVDVEGKWVVPPIYSDVKDFREGLAAVQVTDVGGARWGYIDRDGKTVVPPCYFSAESFSEGFAVVGDAGKYGYIDRKGGIVLEMKFYRAGNFHLGTASVSAGDSRRLINVRGEGIPLTDVSEIGKPVSTGYIAAGTLFEWKNCRYGVISPTGKWLVEPLYQYVDPGDGTFPLAATRDGIACLVNADGSVIAVDSKGIRYLGCGYFACSQKDGERVIDRTGKVIFSTPFWVFKAQEVPLPGPASGKGK